MTGTRILRQPRMGPVHGRLYLACVAVIAAVAVSSCGGGGGGGASSSTTRTATTTAAAATGSAARTTPSCGAVSAADLRAVGASAPARIEHYAPAPGIHRLCSDLFIDSSGAQILALAELPAGHHPLAAAHAAAQAVAEPSARIRRLPAGLVGFSVDREVALVHGGRLVNLEAGFSTSGAPLLTGAQLLHLARLVVAR